MLEYEKWIKPDKTLVTINFKFQPSPSPSRDALGSRPCRRLEVDATPRASPLCALELRRTRTRTHTIAHDATNCESIDIERGAISDPATPSLGTETSPVIVCHSGNGKLQLSSLRYYTV